MSKITVFDVAKYILEKQGEMTAMKLQKLVYYSKAWSLVWDEDELFSEEIQAWANGAVVPDLFFKHKGVFKVAADFFNEGDSSHLSINQKDTIDKVLDFYGNYSAQQLSDINHQEDPWKEARGDLPPMVKCTAIITSGSIFEYYSGISPNVQTE